MEIPIYIFSGLGADERVFQKIDFSASPVTFVRWIAPEENETIEAYAARLIQQQIKTENPILIGLSFGGIIAVEVAKQIAVKKIIMIASAKTKYEIPFYFRLAGILKLHKIVPSQVLKMSNCISEWFFGISTTFERQLFNQIVQDTDPIFLKWAIDKIVCWKNTYIAPNIRHIHGTKDRILPICFVKCDLEIAGGGHLMTLNKEKQLSQILQKELAEA